MKNKIHESWRSFLREARDWDGQPIGHEPTHPGKKPGVDDAYGDLDGAKQSQRDQDKELWDKLSQQDKEEESESSVVGGDALGQFIVDHGDGDAQQALNHLEDEIQEMEDEIQEMEMMREAINDLIADEKRQEINDMMDEEEEEIQFAKDNPEYTTRKF
jgi:hypothetical protein